ncbi:hypothetical protein CPB86DRAFT_801622 [Serendipita vermifera]|nr:hypothetical protein CPB86DRAFT_801622 [Serendipita vermifera]
MSEMEYSPNELPKRGGLSNKEFMKDPEKWPKQFEQIKCSGDKAERRKAQVRKPQKVASQEPSSITSSPDADTESRDFEAVFERLMEIHDRLGESWIKLYTAIKQSGLVGFNPRDKSVESAGQSEDYSDFE